MIRRNLFLILATALSAMASAQSGSAMQMEVEVNDGVYEDVSGLRQRRRELYSFGSFSFSSLLFSLHMCEVDPTCPSKVHRPPISQYCPGCPDCNHISGPKSEKWLKGWCASNSDSSTSDEAAEGEEGEVDAADADVEKNGAGGQPSAARTMNWLIFAAAAAVTVTALVAAVMRKRQEEGDGMKATDPNHSLTGSIAKRMMGGMGLGTLAGGDEASTIVTEDNTMGTNFIAMDPVSEAADADVPAEQGIEIDEGEPIVPGSRYQV